MAARTPHPAHPRAQDTDENKLAYTEVFAQYTELVEGGIERRLQASVPGFDMDSFMAMLDARKVGRGWRWHLRMRGRCGGGGQWMASSDAGKVWTGVC